MQVSSRSRSAETGPPGERRAEYRRVLFSSYLGTTIEFYDFLLYGTAAALVFPAVFFSGLDEFTGVHLLLRHLRRRLPRPPARRRHLRALRRPLGRKKMLVV